MSNTTHKGEPKVNFPEYLAEQSKPLTPREARELERRLLQGALSEIQFLQRQVHEMSQLNHRTERMLRLFEGDRGQQPMGAMAGGITWDIERRLKEIEIALTTEQPPQPETGKP